MRDLIITWPKTRSLDSYLEACEAARVHAEVLNFRIHNPPTEWHEGMRVYVVHARAVRGWHQLLDVCRRGYREVRDPGGGWWPPGTYLVRHAEWHPIEPIPMRGFQGWHYFERPE